MRETSVIGKRKTCPPSYVPRLATELNDRINTRSACFHVQGSDRAPPFGRTMGRTPPPPPADSKIYAQNEGRRCKRICVLVTVLLAIRPLQPDHKQKVATRTPWQAGPIVTPHRSAKKKKSVQSGAHLRVRRHMGVAIKSGAGGGGGGGKKKKKAPDASCAVVNSTAALNPPGRCNDRDGVAKARSTSSSTDRDRDQRRAGVLLPRGGGPGGAPACFRIRRCARQMLGAGTAAANPPTYTDLGVEREARPSR